MRILDSLAALDRTTDVKPVVALGNFDGVHLGHQAIFQRVVERAREIGGVSMVFTLALGARCVTRDLVLGPGDRIDVEIPVNLDFMEAVCDR